jgi:DNA invertase Pin-like site-specific DNA recombinase
MKIALYFRVSTEDQTNEPQRLELLEYCRRRGWTDVHEFHDKASGAKFSRIGLDLMMVQVRKRKFDAVLCVKLDRLGRSLAHLAQLIGEIEAAGAAIICTSQGIDTSNDNPAGRLQMHVLMAVAEFERTLIAERTRAGLAAARERGSVLGRPKFVVTETELAIITEHQGSIAKLAKKLGCSVGLAHKMRKEFGF